ncbi:MAG: uracil phosphoribosyltransferase [Deltaproteobacteria bacterium]|nr:uracil phosphoribosyltransferase [Deltaproteobacteria bacterium]MCB9786996.1 uracil phosphoribosyltransferase [Deltaproteobacteria bacterium]
MHPAHQDAAYRTENLVRGELRHLYGDRVHLLSDPYHLALLARLGAERTFQPTVNHLVTTLYRDLIAAVVAREFPTAAIETPTRMIAHSPAGVFRGEVVDPLTRAVCVDIARAGMLPAQVCFDALNHVLDPSGVRQDHLVMNRVTDADGHVVDARIFGEKTGGDIGGRFLLFPDPMGATGTSVVKAIRYYREVAGGVPRRIITMNLIVTPEFVRNLRATCPEVVIYAFRLDRGLSDPEVLASLPGTHAERERGLDDTQYIIPGAGGLGEVINNVFV